MCTHRYVSTAVSLVTGWVSAPLTPPPLASASSVALQSTPVSNARRKSQQVPLTGCRDVLLLQYIVLCIMLSHHHSSCVAICGKCYIVTMNACVCTPTHTGEFPYAKCFICNEMGHLSRSCPDNPRGLYPKGKGKRTSTVHTTCTCNE